MEKEKYLSIVLLGKNGIRCAAFLNKDKKKENEPDFKGHGVAVWVNQMPDKSPVQTETVL